MIRIGVVGYGYWGPNIVRNFSQLAHVTVSWICDVNKKTIEHINRQYPAAQKTVQYRDVLNDATTDAVVIATPTSTHFAIAKEAILRGKHVLVEKPMTQTTQEAQTLVTLAKRKKKILMVDHTFIYTAAIQKIKTILSQKQLGNVFYVDCVRANLGLLQKDANVIYDLATHDFSIMDYLFKCSPQAVSATGIHLAHSNQEAVAYVTVQYPHHLYVHSHVSWLSPVKIRRITFTGTQKMLMYDDEEPTEKVKIYDKSILVNKDPSQQYQLRVGYRIGSTVSPHIEVQEGLAGVTYAFVQAIK
ncbi:oxidoreductase, partial [Candidatus Gottesmanbacteria bacterium RBG_13_45_10]